MAGVRHRLLFAIYGALACTVVNQANAQGPWTSQTRSVISGPNTFFAPQLPRSLQVPHFAPDPAHPNLRFWFAPDSFEDDSVADSSPVSLWRNLARIGINGNEVQTQSAAPQQAEALMQPTYAMQPIFKKSVLNGRGVVRFTRGDTFGLSGQKLEIYNNATSTVKGFINSSTNPFQYNSSNEWTIFLVARTTQATGDTGVMGILSGLSSNSLAEEKGLHIYKACSACLANGGSAPNCYPGKYTAFSTLNLKYGQSTTNLTNGEVDENHCGDTCAAGCGVDAIPAACLSKWGPSGKQNLQDPDKGFRIITAKAARVAGSTKVKVSLFVDGFHSSSQPLGYITGNASSNAYASTDPGVTVASITTLMLGAKAMADGSSPAYMSGDVAELMIYNRALTVPEMDRLGNYLSRKYALPDFRLDNDYRSPTRSVPVSCTNCAGPGPVGEAGITYDSHVSPADAPYSGTLANVTNDFTFTVATGTEAINGLTNALVGMVLTVCNGSCTAAQANIRGTTVVLTSTSAAPNGSAVTVSSNMTGVTAGDGYFLSGRGFCAEDLGAVVAVTSPTQVRLVGTVTGWPSGNNASAGLLLSVCAGVCTRSLTTGTITNLRGAARVLSSTTAVGQVVVLATAIPGIAVGDSFVLYNAHKVRLQQASNSTGIGGVAVDNFYSFAGHHMYFRAPGQCAGRGARIVRYDSASKCAYLGSILEVGNYLGNSTAVIAAADRAADGACRGSSCIGPDVGGIGGGASGHVSSIKILTLSTSGCTVGTTLTIPSDPSGFTATVSSVSNGAITGITIYNHGAGFRAGAQVVAHGSLVGAVTSGTQFVLSSGAGAAAAAAANALAGMTIVVCSGICTISSAGVVTNARGASLIASSTAGTSPNVTLYSSITGVSTFDEYTLYTGPALVSSDAACLCQSSSFENATVAHRSMGCLLPVVSVWADGQDSCAAGGYQSYLIVKDSDTRAVVASDYFKGNNLVGSAGNADSGPSAGGTAFIARGAYLFPNDVHVSQAPSVSNVQLATGEDAALNAQYLKVTFGADCSMNPDAANYCLNARPELQATGCTLYSYPRGYDPAGQALTTATDFSPVGDVPELRCLAPAGAGAQRDLNIYWHGVAVTLDSWWHYSAPVVRSISPSGASYAGGTVITVTGSNFGPPETWATVSAGGAKGTAGVKTAVELVGRGVQACLNVQWVSDSQLVCTVPPLPLMKQPIDIVQHLVSVQVVVSVDQQESAQGPSSGLQYTGVPAYFACDTSLAKDACFTCCRSSCIVDAFAQGGAAGAATMGNCDQACYSYCGFNAAPAVAA